MKTLITHLRPHLDDICALWLMKRYLPEARDAGVDFIPTDEKGGKPIADPELVYIGVGRGPFDEHKGDVGDCATTLVWKYVEPRANLADDVERRAIKKIVDWVFQEDTGRLNTVPFRPFTVPSIIEGYFDEYGRDSGKTTEFGFQMLDALLVMQRNEARLDDDWARRREFTSRWGKAVAVVGTSRQIDSHAYAQGFPVAVIMNPDATYHTVRADASSTVDLTPVYDEVHRREPQASWYLHHSKKMLICGGDHSPNAVPSKLTLDELIALLV